MKNAFKYFGLFCSLNCILSFEVNAQVFGATPSQETFQNTFSAEKQQMGNKQVQKPVQFKAVGENTPQAEPNKKKPIIKIYMDNFRIVPSFSKTTQCMMTFHVDSTIETPISNISFRLKWPNMETPVSFDNVPVGKVPSQNYMLYGDGCYQMDTPPTVIVNRCRVKGLTQEACTDLIKWVQ